MHKIKFITLAIVSLLFSCSRGPKLVLEKAQDATFIIYTFDEHGSPAGSGSGFFIDKDGTGKISKDEVKTILNNEDIDEEELKQFIAKFDLNEDGEIDYYELITCMDNIIKDDNDQPYDS